MKNQIKNILFLLLIGLFFVTCTEKKNNNVITGVVQEIQNGKDGYTAQIKTAANKIYFVTISIPNLKDHTQYRSVQVGETIAVEGDLFDVGSEKHIAVRQLYPMK